MRIFFIAFLSSIIYSQYHSSEWGSITSLLTPTGIQTKDDGTVYASTSGGLLEFNPYKEEFNFIKMEEGLIYLDLATIAIDSLGRIWMGGAYPRGCLQVFDPEIGLVNFFEDALIESINNIQIGETMAFSAYQEATSSDVGILEFELDEDGLPEYQDYYTDFTDETITDIYDLDLFQDSLYITTDQGIFVGNSTDNLKSSSNWIKVYSGNDAKQFLPGNPSFILGDSYVLYRQDDDWEDYCISFSGNIIKAKKKDEKIGILTEEHFYEINDCVIDSFHIPVGDQSNTTNAFGYDLRTYFTSFDYNSDGNVFIGIKDNGILYLDKGQENHFTYVPNTPIKNEFQAITITESGNMAATSHYGTLFFNRVNYKNYIPNNYFKYYTNGSEAFHAIGLDYHSGYHQPISIIEKENGNLIYCNSGVSSDSGGAVIELNHTNGIITKYDNTDNIIDGFWGIVNPDIFSEYMVVNQIEKDKFGNIWIVNPFCEKYGHLLAIQLNTSENWVHVVIPDSSSFRPQTIALEDRGSYQRAWIGFAYDSRDHILYSNGGIKVLQYSNHNLENMTDTSWINITNPEIVPGGIEQSIWSLVIDHMGILWVLSEKGIQGYEINGYNEIELDPLREYLNDQNDEVPVNYLTQYSFVKGNRIRVDSQNNKWIITHQGIWVIQESMSYWPSEEGLHPGNSGLLSDVVYDVAFDNDKGIAYIATSKGISILQIPFAENPTKKQSIYISPNPFIIPEDEFVIIKNIPSGSTIKIMTITGKMIKTIELDTHISQALWDGRTNQGEVVGTAIYLVAAHHPTEQNKVSKIAVIRK